MLWAVKISRAHVRGISGQPRERFQHVARVGLDESLVRMPAVSVGDLDVGRTRCGDDAPRLAHVLFVLLAT